MTNSDKKPPIAKLLKDIAANPELEHHPAPQTGLDPYVALLRSWQSARLANTYADLLEDPRFRSACLYFLNSIYAPQDFSQRDYDIERLHAFLSRMLPAVMLKLLTDVVELNQLTNRLDQRLVHVLIHELGMQEEITPELYAAAYRICDNYAERDEQIGLIVRVLKEVSQGARLAMVGLAIKALRSPAHRVGWVELYEFLEKGHAAFKGMKDHEIFVSTIEQREKTILDRIFANNSDPFSG
jgi:hypothetical protein